MAQITINIPDAQVQRVIDGLAVQFGVDATAAAVKAELIRVVKRWVKGAESQQAATTFSQQYSDPDVS